MRAMPQKLLRWHHSLIICVITVLSISCIQAEDELFLDCAIDDYYGDLLASSPESWQPGTISNLLRETHRNVLPYTSSADDVWDALIDLDSTDGLIRLIYSEVPVNALEFGTPETWNREHLWPRSRGVQESGPDNTDVNALRPADWNVNSVRQSLFFGDCQDTCTSRPADQEAGDDTARNSDMFLPPANQRGDIARAIFYMERRYSFDDEVDTENLELTDCPDAGATNQMAYLSDLLRWHEEDPPDDDERRRNERVCARWQGNRNPFIDYPQLVVSIYGSPADKPYDCGGFVDGEEGTSPTGSPTTVATTGGEIPSTGTPVSIPGTCSQLLAGDVQIISVAADNPDAVVLVALADLPAGLELYMTDNAWTGTDFASNEGTMKLVLTEGLSAGSVLGSGDSALIPFGGSWESVGSGSFALAVDGDSVIVYCLREDGGDYNHLGALIVGQWSPENTSELSSNDSQLPEALQSIGAIEIEEGWDNVMYTGPNYGTKSELLLALADQSNWLGSNTEQSVYNGGNFEITDVNVSKYAYRGNNLPSGGGDDDGILGWSGVRLMACLSVILVLIQM